MRNKIIHALIFGAAMIIASLIVEDREASQSLVILFIGIWVATGGLSGSRDEIACLKATLFR
jgi:hypothetical protein